MLRWSALWALPLLGSLRCGGIAIIDASGGAGGSGVDQACGGPDNLPCGGDSYCALPVGAACTDLGRCQPRPLECDYNSCPGTCDCNSQFFCNACDAHRFGGVISTTNFCPLVTDGPYHSWVRVDGSDMIVMQLLDVDAGPCVRMHAKLDAAPSFDVDVFAGWQLTSMTVYDGTQGCLNPSVTPTGPQAVATMAKGTVHAAGNCSLWFHFEEVSFTQSWATVFLPIASGPIPMSGGCP